MLLSRPPRPAALGGVELHVDALLSLSPTSFAVYAAYPQAGELLVETAHPRELVAALPLVSGPPPLEPNPGLVDALAAVIVGIDADVLHVHSPALGPATIASVLGQTGVRSAVTLHDHSLVCENYELLEGGVRYCGVPADLGRCDRCLEKTRGRRGGAVQEWRSAVRSLTAEIDAVVAPSDSVLEHAARLYPEVRGRAHRIDWGVPEPSARSTVTARDGALRVAVVGLLSVVKGRHRMAELISSVRDLDVEWHLFGATEGESFRDVRRAGARVVVHGAYRRSALATRLVESGCHVAILPSVGAEAFSLTLSEVTSAGVPVMASDLGALGERVRRSGLGWNFDPWDGESFRRLLSGLERDRGEIDRVAAHVRGLERRTEEAMVAEYSDLWAKLAGLPRRARAVDQRKAMDSFAAGTRLSVARRPGRLGRAINRFRESDFYRDLRLRQLLPVDARKRIEHAALRLAARKGRR
jgi:glycosyltransferase involved in cell wall biosynthesis